MRIDLHSHSTASDGTEQPSEVVARAHAVGIDVLALTDHDTVDGIASAVDSLPSGLGLVAGCEVSCATEVAGLRVSVHLLGYLFNPAEPTLAEELALLRRDREIRGRAIIDRLRALGAPVTWDEVTAIAGGAAVGRPHIARALVRAGVVTEPEQAFSLDWIGYAGRAYVPKRALDPTTAVHLVAAAGGVSVLAHPGAGKRGQLLPEEAIAGLAGDGLAGMEVDHPDHDEATRARLRGLAGDLGLVATGSSDDHGALTGHRLGCETTSPDAFEQLIAGATGAGIVRR